MKSVLRSRLFLKLAVVRVGLYQRSLVDEADTIQSDSHRLHYLIRIEVDVCAVDNTISPLIDQLAPALVQIVRCVNETWATYSRT